MNMMCCLLGVYGYMFSVAIQYFRRSIGRLWNSPRCSGQNGQTCSFAIRSIASSYAPGRAFCLFTKSLILHRCRNNHRFVRRVVGDGEVFGTEVEKIGHGRIHEHRWEYARLAIQKLFYVLELAFVNVCVGNSIDEFFWRVARCLSDHHRKRSILDNVKHNANWDVATTLEVMHRKLLCFWKDKNMQIAVAWRNNNLTGRNPRMLQRVLRNPWRDDVRAQIWTLLDLLYDVFDLIERFAFACWKRRPCWAVATRTEIAFG